MTIPCFQPKIKIPKAISIENDSVGSPIPDSGAPESSSSDEKSTIEPSISPSEMEQENHQGKTTHVSAVLAGHVRPEIDEGTAEI